MKLILVRHTSVAVPKGVCYGQSDVSLAETFPQEAAEVKNKLLKYDIAHSFTSPLSRCTKLSEACGFKEAIRDDRLMEMNFGSWEMRRYDEISDPRLQQWFDDYINIRATGGESFMDQRRRFISFVKSLPLDNRESTVIFTHAGIIVQAMTLYLGYSVQDAFAKGLPYGAIIEIDLTTSSYHECLHNQDAK